MEHHTKMNWFLLPVVFLVFTIQGFCQDKYSLSESKEMKVSGTSTIHDWDMVAEGGVTGTAQLTMEGNKLMDISRFKVELKAESLKSGNNKMDKNAYEALTTNKHPSIIFELTGPSKIMGNKISTTGKLSISGSSQTIPVEVTYSAYGNSVNFIGSKEIKFSDFKIEPPKAVFGTIKTGNELQLSFNIVFTKAP
jgi:polyisoprenoid-binding protein YceI